MTKTILALAIAASATFGVGSVFTANEAFAAHSKRVCVWKYGVKKCHWVKIKHKKTYSAY